MSKKGKVGFTVRLKDRVAVVTGAASGIGKQIAIVFAKGGARGAVSDIDLDGAKATAEEIKAGNGVAFAMKTNVALEEDIQALIDTTVGKYGTVDILVNNAGIMDDMEPAGDIEDRNWERIFTVNTTGVMRTTRKVLPIMLEKGKGVIINVASAGGLFGARAGVAHCVKACGYRLYEKHRLHVRPERNPVQRHRSGSCDHQHRFYNDQY